MLQKVLSVQRLQGIKGTGLFLTSVLLLSACSSERHNFFSRTYHNLSAHYNAYFLASQKMEEIEKAAEQKPDNFDYILPVYYDIDSSTALELKAPIEECIKFSSMPVVRHRNSRWTDDSYLLIGKAHFYEGDFQKARITFEYLLSSSKDEAIKDRAMLILGRLFIEQKVFQNLKPVFNYFDEKKPDKEILRDLLLLKAHFFSKEKKYDSLSYYLMRAIPFVKNNEQKGRLYFVEGQVCEYLDRKEEARKNYVAASKLNVPYELLLHARLGIFRTGKSSDGAEKFYAGQVKEDKNRDLLDKIYYEWAFHKFRIGKEEEGTQLLQKSLSMAPTPARKAPAWLKIGAIRFERDRDYSSAKLYYDSAVSGLTPEHPLYRGAELRKRVLTELSDYAKTIRMEDSLRVLARKESTELEQILDRLVTAKMEAEKKARETKATSSGLEMNSEPLNTLLPSAGRFGNVAPVASSGWYFANASVIAAGQAEFRRVWGARKLEDHWRRKNKKGGASATYEDESLSVAKQSDGTASDTAYREAYKKKLREQIPFSEAAFKLSEKKTEKALLGAGNVCFLQLRDTTLAKEYFNELLNRFPVSELTPEVLYAMYLMHRDDRSKTTLYKGRLLQEYPDSRFAKIALDPDYFINSKDSAQKFEKQYGEAYQLYKIEKYEEASKLLGHLQLERSPEALKEKKEVLEALIIGKLKGEEALRQALVKFLESKKNKNTEAVVYASELLERMNTKQERKNGTSFKKP